MIGLIALFLQQGPDAHYAGGASSKTAGTTALAGHFFRFLFSTVPPWVQIAGILVGGPLALIAVWQAWKHRRRLWAWWQSRRGWVQLSLISTAAVAAIVAAGTGTVGYNYVMHQNDFCQSCHIMDTAWNRFQVSAHKDIQCHACHRQPLYASTVELFWWVTERRMVIPPHDKVPTAVCSECHLRQGSDSTRTLITLTAGHAVHLKSDSAALKHVECTTCHGRDFHVFIPTHASCSQSGCHSSTRVTLGAMSKQGFLHCTTCHNFRNRVDRNATATQARAQLTPQALECASCHAMGAKIDKFDLSVDPHRGSCGSCHNAHKDSTTKDAYKSCATSQCHGNAIDTLTSFHRGLGGRHKLDNCGACHPSHSWKVKGNNCLACHKTIFDDKPAAKRVSMRSAPHAPRRGSGAHGATPVLFRPISLAPPSPVPKAVRSPPPDSTFPHSRHRSVACQTCHATNASHGPLKISRPDGCQACHHAPNQAARCSACHANGAVAPRPVPMAFTITPRRDPVSRPVSFAHERHATLECARCHGSDGKRNVTTTCASCHAEHHTPAADCATCHPTARAGHDRAAHIGCAGCHTDATVAALPPSRNVCLACHQQQRDHFPARDCAVCHATTEDVARAAGVSRTR